MFRSTWLVDPLPLNYEVLDRGFARIEKGLFDKGGSFPFVHPIFGTGRMVYGTTQLVVAIALSVFNLIRAIFVSEEEKQPLAADGMKVLSYAWHGIANITRGQIESFPVINLFCPIYSYVGKWRMKYEEEDTPERQEPFTPFSPPRYRTTPVAHHPSC